MPASMPTQVQYLNAHGTSTPLGDVNETNAIKLAFGDHAKQLVVNSTKSMTGHLLGGAGGIESVFTVLALHHQVSPPTINIFNQDPRVRPGLLRQHGARHEDRRGGEEQLRLRRHQRHAGLPARLTPRRSRRACALPRQSRPCPAAPGVWRSLQLALCAAGRGVSRPLGRQPSASAAARGVALASLALGLARRRLGGSWRGAGRHGDCAGTARPGRVHAPDDGRSRGR